MATTQRKSARDGKPTPARGKGGSRARRLLLRFVGVFAVLVIAFFVLTGSDWFQRVLLAPYIRTTAAAAGSVLRLAGEGVRVDAFEISSSAFSMSVQRGCDAIDPIALFSAGLIALPGLRTRRRIVALGAGVLALIALNFIRIISLWYIGVHRRPWFDAMHVEVWQTGFIFVAVVFWVAGAVWASKRQPRRTEGGPVGRTA